MKNISYSLVLITFLLNSFISKAQYPENTKVIHPFATFDGIGEQCYTVDDNTENIYFGTNDRYILKLDNIDDNDFECIKLKDIPAGISVKTGCLHFNNDHLIIGSTFSYLLMIYDLEGNLNWIKNLSIDGINSFVSYFIDEDNDDYTDYYFGCTHKSDLPTIVKLHFVKDYPESSTYEVIKLDGTGVAPTTSTRSIRRIGYHLFISTYDGKIIRYDINDNTSTQFDSGTNSYIRYIVADGSDIYATIETDLTSKRFWRIKNAESSTPEFQFTYSDSRLYRMYIPPAPSEFIYLQSNKRYNKTSKVIENYTFTPAGFDVLDIHSNYIIGFDRRAKCDPNKWNKKELVKINLSTKSTAYQKYLVDDVQFPNDGSIIETIEASGNFLYTSAYHDGFNHKIESSNIDDIEFYQQRCQADVIKKVDITGSPYLFYGCYGGTNCAQIKIVRPGGVLSKPDNELWKIISHPDVQKWSRIISITSNTSNVFFGTGEQYEPSDAKPCVILYDSKTNYTDVNYKLEDLKKLNLDSYFNNLEEPIRIIAMYSDANYLYGITGGRASLDDNRLFRDSYFFRVNITNLDTPTDFKFIKLEDKISKHFGNKLIIPDGDKLYVGAGSEVLEYNTNNFTINSPIKHNISDENNPIENHIISIVLNNNNFYVCFNQKIKVFSDDFTLLGYFQMPSENCENNYFKDMTICNNKVFVVSQLGILYEYDADKFIREPKIHVGDFNGDGMDDIAIQEEDRLVFKLRGYNNWLEVIEIANPWQWDWDVYAVEFNNDSKTDFVVRKSNKELWLYPWNGNSWGVVRKIGAGWEGSWDYYFGDFTGDGINDIVVRRPNEELWIYPWDGDKYWGNIKRMDTDWPSDWHIYSVDFTGLSGAGEGKTDFVVRKPNKELWLYPWGDNDWVNERKIGAGWEDDWDLYFGDFTGDGINDIFARRPNEELWIYPWDGNKYWGNISKPGSGWKSYNTYYIGKFSNDNVMDILSVNTKNELTLFDGTSNTWNINLIGHVINSPAMVPYNTGFDKVDNHWILKSSSYYSSIEQNDSKILLGLAEFTWDLETNEAWLLTDLADYNNLELHLKWMSNSYEHYDYEDGIFFSDNKGASFTKVYDFKTNNYNTWISVNLDIDNLCTLHGLELNKDFVIKFQQKNEYDSSFSGITLDDVEITEDGIPFIKKGNLKINQNVETNSSDEIKLYPNPFIDVVSMEYSLSSDSHVHVTIYDILGKQVNLLQDSEQLSGIHKITWDGSDNLGNQMKEGVYFISFLISSNNETKSIVKKILKN